MNSIYLSFGILAILLILGVLIYCCYLKKRVSSLLSKHIDVCIQTIQTKSIIFIIDDKYNILKSYNILSDSVLCPSEGTNLLDVLIGENNTLFLNQVDEIKRINSSQSFEYLLYDEKGETHYYIGYLTRIYKDCIMAIFRNEDEEKHSKLIIEQNQVILGSILDNMPFPVMLKDINDDFRYIYWNKECDNLAGFKREDVLGKTDLDIYGKERGQEYREKDLEIVNLGQNYRNHETFVTPDGTNHDTIVSKVVITNDFNKWILVVRWDITDLAEVQRSLNLANNQLRLAFAAGNIIPWIWDIATNKFYLKTKDLKGVNEELAIDEDGVSVRFLMSRICPADRRKMIKHIIKLRNGIIDKANFVIRYDVNKNFNNFYNIYSIVESFDKKGVPIKIIGSIQNITEQKKFEEDIIIANETIEQVVKTNEIILDNTDIGLAYISPDYMVQWENASKYSEHPIAKNYKAGVRCYENVNKFSEPCPNCIMKTALLSGKREEKEVEFSGGSIAQIVASPVFDSNNVCLGIVLKIKDITEEKQREQDLRTAKENAEKSDRLKSAFLANMSHEIRTPLNAILGFSELLSIAEDPEEKENYLKVINSNNDLLLQLINDILDLSKIEANTLEFVFADVDVNVMMSELERSFRFKASQNKALEIVFEKKMDDGLIRADKNRLQQIISNFITNAMKFTEQGLISFGCERRGSNIYFYVTDTGMGIPKNKLDDVFKRFTKLNNFKAGTGLGLTICQTIVHKLNGEIGVVSELGEGSTFWFTIPWEAPLGDSDTSLFDEVNNKEELSVKKTETLGVITPKDGAVNNNEPISLLIAEDVVDNYRLYESLLKNKYNLLHAWNGKEAIELYEKNRPKAILMDIKMPEMDGYAATAVIRQTDTHIPIVAVTAFAFDEDKNHILASGFTDFITKPILKQSLFDVLKKIGI